VVDSIVVGQDDAGSSLGFKGLRIQGVRSEQAGVTRYLLADPLLAFTSSRDSPTRSRPRASAKPPLMGFDTTPGGLPPVAVFALQSIKEPRDEPFSFETGHPP